MGIPAAAASGAARRQQRILWLLSAAALLVVLLSMVGAWLLYSPVPFWDMWTGTLQFYMRAAGGDSAVWWSQHNEHRIFLARLLFWADLRWFGGVSAFLVVANFALVAAAAFQFYLILRALSGGPEHAFGRAVLQLITTAWLFQWMQFDNLVWGFQSQFILAQLLPLCGLYMLARAATTSAVLDAHYIGGCAYGVASLGTMANGVLALPLMFVFALFTRQARARQIILALLSVLGLYAYFHNYHAVAAHGALMVALKGNPLGFLQYVLLYLGSPFYYLFGAHHFGHVVAVLMGAVLVLGALCCLAGLLTQMPKKPLPLAMLFFIAYIGSTAVGTAGGRLFLGVDQSLTSRYTTPALMAWAAMLVLVAPAVMRGLQRFGKRWLLPLGLLSVLMLAAQRPALHPDVTMLFDRKLAALALEMGVRDKVQIARVVFDAGKGLELARQAGDAGLSVFGRYPFRDVHQQLGAPVTSFAAATCETGALQLQSVDDDTRFLRLKGWVMTATESERPQALRLINHQGRMAGYALIDQHSQAAAAAAGRSARMYRFEGYILAQDGNSGIFMDSPDSVCQYQLRLPGLPVAATIEAPSATTTAVQLKNVLAGNEWLGADYQKSTFAGMQVLASMAHGDADVGTVRIQVRHGDRLFFRTGPTPGRQTLAVAGSDMPPLVLPVAPEWSVLELSGKNFPDGEFILILSDSGSAWGEWSAIAVRN